MDFDIPTLNWFESNPWAKVGNRWSGSVGATSIHNNAFLYIINYYRPEDEDPKLVAETYDSLIEMAKEDDKRLKKEFPGTKEGREEMIEWITMQYNEYIDSGKNKEKIYFNK